MIQPPQPDPDVLLSHAHSLRAIARSLLRNEADVEDVVQETWLAALRAQPDDEKRIGGWLATVTRNFSLMRLRARRSRTTHEPHARAPAPPDSPDTVAEHFEDARILADAVAKLDEPYRQTILLRYFADLTPTEIARQTNVPDGTVRSRLKRGLDQLRAMFAERHGGDRRAMLLALGGLAGLGEAGTAGGLLAKLVIAGAAAGVATVIAVGSLQSSESDADGSRAGSPPNALAAAEQAAGESTPPISAIELPAIRGTVFAPWGDPAPGATVTLASSDQRLAQTTSDSAGGFAFSGIELDPSDNPRALELTARAPGVGVGGTPVRNEHDGIEIALRALFERSGVVVTPEGAPIEGARVGERYFDNSVLTDREGRYRAMTMSAQITAHHPDYASAEVVGGGRIVLHPWSVLQGVVVSHDGARRIADAEVSFSKY